ncbi:MAG: PEP-CTERM sorting domain-containing protein [Thermoplasmata archaeon]|jgi:hypothetical protein|nr:MAG: PEP-CTERM sorting domain-containing protein [Thermoplasmata archaeon]
MMKLGKYGKINLVLLAMGVQSMLFNWLMNSNLKNVDVKVAGEIPEPGTILLFALGGFVLYRWDKNRER